MLTLAFLEMLIGSGEIFREMQKDTTKRDTDRIEFLEHLKRNVLSHGDTEKGKLESHNNFISLFSLTQRERHAKHLDGTGN